MTTVFNPATGTKREFTEADLQSILTAIAGITGGGGGGSTSAQTIGDGMGLQPAATNAGSPNKNLADILVALTGTSAGSVAKLLTDILAKLLTAQALADTNGLAPASVAAGSPAKLLADILTALGGTLTAARAKPLYSSTLEVSLSAATSAALLSSHATRMRHFFTNKSTTDYVYVRHYTPGASLTAFDYRIPPGATYISDYYESGGMNIYGYCPTAAAVQAGYFFN